MISITSLSHERTIDFTFFVYQLQPTVSIVVKFVRPLHLLKKTNWRDLVGLCDYIYHNLFS
jgi:hypothetical protein